MQKALNGHPVMRFFAVAGASIISMGLAGKVVREGGLRLVEKAQTIAHSGTPRGLQFSSSIKSFRKIQSYLDDLQGIERELVDPQDEINLVLRRAGSRKLLTDRVTDIDNFSFRVAARNEDPSVPVWTMRDALQKKLVSQARRMPYEMPGLYLSQKAIIDPLFGREDRNKVNWKNPFDVMGDFAWESMKNLGLNVLPFELGSTAVAQKYKSLAYNMSQMPGDNLNYLALRTGLEQVGASFADIFNRTIRFSHQSTGAFSSLVDDAAKAQVGFGDWIKQRSSAMSSDSLYKNSNYARRLFMQAKDISKNADARKKAIDILPGPFKGMGTAIGNYGTNFKRIGKTYDNLQEVLSGRSTLQQIRKSNIEDYKDLIAFMRKGGGSHIEQYAHSIFELGHGGPRLPDGAVNPDWRTGRFYNTSVRETYKSLLIDQLTSAHGLSPETALKFVSRADIVPPQGGSAFSRSNENLVERFKFTKSRSQAKGRDEWWESVVRTSKRNRINLGDDFTLSVFEDAVRKTDAAFSSRGAKALMESDIESQWNYIHGRVIPQHANASMRGIKKPYEFFSGSYSANAKDFLLKRTAQKLGIDIFDAHGNAIPVNSIKQQIWNRGLNPDSQSRLQGYLMSQKEIANPWSLAGRSIFGFRPMTVNEAMTNGYFGGNPATVRKEISNIVNARTFGPLRGRGGNRDPSLFGDSRWDLKLDGVYVGPGNRVVDIGKVKRSVVAGLDKFADEYQIPLLHMKPLQAAGWSFFKSGRNANPILIETGLFNHLQPASSVSGRPNFHMWLKSSGRRSTGSLISVSGNSLDGIDHITHNGSFRPNRINRDGMAGRYGRIFIGDQGFPSSKIQGDPNATKLDKFKSFFSISNDQEEGLFGKRGLFSRWMSSLQRKPSSYSSPYRAAERFANPNFIASRMTGVESEGLDNLLALLRNYGFSDRTLREISRDPKFKHIFDIADSLNRDPLSIQPELLPQLITDILARDKSILSGTSGREISKLQQNLKNLLRQAETQQNYWNLSAPNAMKSAGISSRQDQLKSEFYTYLVARSQVVGGEKGATFATTVKDLMSKIEELYASGSITRAERTEARAAILGLQLENARNATFKSDSAYTFIGHNQKTLNHALQNGTDVRQLLSEVGRFEQGNTGRVSPRLRRLTRNLIDTTPYEIDDEMDPFSGAKHLFVPTFSTAYANNPRKALAGLIGANWRDKEAISGMAMPMTHMAMRLNRYFETFNIGLDPLRFKGPMDFYTRGIIGQRVLPIYATGVTALAADRTLGGALNERDQDGNKVYSPYVLGQVADVVAKGQVALAGITPGGQTAAEKQYELTRGEVPIRQGRYWVFGQTPYKGGRVQYFRPSWYRRFKSGASFTPESKETPMERLAFGYDFSPLRPFDPYRREREDYSSRPYPVTGEYFTGPWGPLNSVLNATAGKILKPQKTMHESEMRYILQQYMPVGESGAYFSSSQITQTPDRYSGYLASQNLSRINSNYMGAGAGTPSSSPFYGSMGYAAPRGMASLEVRNRASQIANSYQSVANRPGSYVNIYQSLVPYGVPARPGAMQPRVMEAVEPTAYGGVLNTYPRRLGYQSQELFGIYGFATASAREALGFGTKDLTPQNAMLEPASRGYSASRSFWGLNLGGLGDFSLPMESKYSNFELSEIIRRFVPKEPSGMNYINNLPNEMGMIYPWLPGQSYPLAPIKSGDPYNAIPDAEIRLPGTGYNRTHRLYPDQFGKMGLVNIHDILADVAPWSQEYKTVDQLMESQYMDHDQFAKVAQTRAQVDAMRNKYEFTPYEYKYRDPTEIVEHPVKEALGRTWEWFAHRDTYLNTKFLPERTALEDWERRNVYGTTFPKWETPVSSFINPSIQKSTQRNPITAALSGGTIGYLFGASPAAKAFGSVIGGTIGLGASAYGAAYEGLTGKRYLPQQRRKEIALEEYTDILSYTRAAVNASRAIKYGNNEAAQFFSQQAQKTMYGMNLNASPEQLAMAVPKRKREHFRAMLYAPEQERDQILSTAGRLERRLLEAAWGRPVEQRPDLREYFESHELPSPESELWSPNLNMDTIKIKVGQSMGLDMSQMGFYPQQIKEANLINPSYPSFNSKSSRHSVEAQIKRLLIDHNIRGTVRSVPNSYGFDQMQLNAGVF